jgi:hypothetical protein
VIRRNNDHETFKIGAISSPTGEALFTDPAGNPEVFVLNGRDPNDETAILAERRLLDPDTHAFVHQPGRIIGAIVEGKHFLWEHKKQEAEGAIAAAAVAATIGVAMHSLHKRRKK